MSFQEICSLDDLVENSGVCVLVAEQQVALFWLRPDDSVGAGELSSGPVPHSELKLRIGASSPECRLLKTR